MTVFDKAWDIVKEHPPLPTCEDCGKKCGPDWIEQGSFTDSGPRCAACVKTLPCEHEPSASDKTICNRCGESIKRN